MSALPAVTELPRTSRGPLRAKGCICGKQMFDRFYGTCVWCGHGDAKDFIDDAYRRNMERNAGPIMRTTPAYDARVVPLRRRTQLWTEDECVSAFIAWKANHGHEPKSYHWQQPREGEVRPTYNYILKLFGGWQAFLGYMKDIPAEQMPRG